MLVVDPHHWLTENGNIPESPARLRKNILRVVRLIEYGGPLEVLHTRVTLVECKRRLKGKPCLGLLWVIKTERHEIQAFCATCKTDDTIIHNWEHTQWADGMMESVPVSIMAEGPPSRDPDQTLN